MAILVAGTATAQPATRRLTTVDALRQYPGYFHLQPVLLRGELAMSGERLMFRSDEQEVHVILNQAKQIAGLVDVRAQLIDVGRLDSSDPRVSGFTRGGDERWPRPGEELVLSVTGIAPAQIATSPSVRGLALEPWKFVGQSVTVVGQFRGRNLFGDLPDAPKKSRYDFVLKAADASIWVTGLRPRGKGLDLNVDARVDTGRWIEVTGVVAHAYGLVSIEAVRVVSGTEPTATAVVDEPATVAVPMPPVEVVFSAPTEGETDVALTAPVRIQFSRNIDAATLKDRIRISYLGAESVEKGELQPPGVEMKVGYDPANRALELSFPKPLERFRTVKVELLEGIKASDGSPVTPWRLTFSVGGS